MGLGLVRRDHGNTFNFHRDGFGSSFGPALELIESHPEGTQLALKAWEAVAAIRVWRAGRRFRSLEEGF